MLCKRVLFVKYRLYLQRKCSFQVGRRKMSSQSLTFNIHGILNTINENLPSEKHITLTEIINYYGNNETISTLICEKLYHLLHCENYKNFLEGPFFQTTLIDFSMCRYVLLWPQDITFTSISVSQIDAEYFCKLSILLWLDKDIFKKGLPKTTRTEYINARLQIAYSTETRNILCKNNRTAWRRVVTNTYSPRINKIFLQNVLQDVNKINQSKDLCHYTGLLWNTSNNLHVFNNHLHNIASSTSDLSRDRHNLDLQTTDVNKNTSEEIVLKNEKSKDVKSKNIASKKTSPKITEFYFIDNEETRTLLKLFPAPKNVLHNLYDELCRETKQKSFKVSPHFKLVKDSKTSMWICTYHVNWPEELKFLAKDAKKSLASHKAALAALCWLNTNKKITKNGLPVIYEKSEKTNLTNKTIPVLSLDQSTLKSMLTIVKLHQDEIVPHIIHSKLEINKDESSLDEIPSVKEPDDVNLTKVKRQKYIGLTQYLAKEKVDLPISAYKNDFINQLKENQIIIVKGEPGCGKSTRVPQYVLEVWAKEDGLLGEPGRIAVTQPRRIAAISLAERVSNERDEVVGDIVGYQVRLKSNFKPRTGRILYCTTGILLRHLQSDPHLSNFTHIILDEAHERDVNTDLLMNLLRSTTKTNPKLKLIIMSATIDTNMFSEFFGGAPVMEIPGFTYPVKQHFLDTCTMNMTNTLKMCNSDVPAVIHEEVVNIIRYIHGNKKEGAILCFLPGWEDINKIQKMIPKNGDTVVYCLHSRLQDSEQWKIFSRAPPGVRKIILSTNIAETSVTIDDVVYVIDTGIQKEQRFDIEKGVNCLDNHWISKASVNQRKGRAGRVQPGESFHLYPKSKYQSFTEYTLPEILKTSLTKIVLDSKVFSNNMNAIEFMRQLPTPPEESVIKKAVGELKDLELLDNEENLTTLGKTLANFQLEPKLSKAMVNAVIFKCVTPIVDIITLFSAETELFISGLLDKSGVKAVKENFSKNSDHLAMMRLFEKWLEYDELGDTYTLNKFCGDTNLMSHKMQTLKKLKNIHFDYLYNGLYDVMPIADNYSDNDELVKAVLYSGVGTVLKYRNWDIVKNRLKNNVRVFLTRNNHKATITTESVNHKRQKFPSNFLVYINETRSNIRRTTLVRECSLISKISVLLFSNKDLEIKEVDKTNFSQNIPSEDQVKLCIENTNIELLCDRAQAQDLIKCKDAIMAGYRYYIRQLTDTGEPNSAVNDAWDRILSLIDGIFSRNSV